MFYVVALHVLNKDTVLLLPPTSHHLAALGSIFIIAVASFNAMECLHNNIIPLITFL